MKTCHSDENLICIIDKSYEHFVLKMYINHIFEIVFNVPISLVTKMTRGLTAAVRLLKSKKNLKDFQIISKDIFPSKVIKLSISDVTQSIF